LTLALAHRSLGAQANQFIMRQRIHAHLLLIATALELAAAAGCAWNPVTRRPQLVALTERQEVAYGRQALADLERGESLAAESPALELVRRTGAGLADLAPGSRYPYAFFVLDDPKPNAFGLPGGVVLVSRGLLLVFNDVDELAGVLGHEIGHVAARHASSRLVWSIPSDILGRLARSAVGVVSRATGDSLGVSVPRLLMAPYERDLEREADLVGVVLAASGGYDPAAFGRALTRLAAIAPSRTDERSAMLASHPPTEERLQVIDLMAAQLERGPRQSTDAWLPVLDGLVVGPDPKNGLLLDGAAVFPSLAVRVALPPEWTHVNSERQFVAVAPGGRAVLQLVATTAREAERAQAALAKEPGFAGLAPLPAPVDWQVTHGVVRHGAADETTSHWYWLARQAIRLELTATWPTNEDEARVADGNRIVASLRALTPAELGDLRVLRLRLESALAGESLTGLAQRTGSAWSAEELALYNGLSVDAPLAAGRMVKVARSEALFP